VQEVASAEDQVRVEDCPVVIDLGLAKRPTVGAGGGGAAKEPAVQGVSAAPIAPQQVLKLSPLTGEEGFELSP